MATLDVLSSGRAICGLGLAWWQWEHALFGWPFPPVAARYARAGYAVTGAQIRSRNQLTEDPAAGSAIIVPLQTSIYHSEGVSTRPAEYAAPAGAQAAGQDDPTGDIQ